jgi:hypothetical protein
MYTCADPGVPHMGCTAHAIPDVHACANPTPTKNNPPLEEDLHSPEK